MTTADRVELLRHCNQKLGSAIERLRPEMNSELMVAEELSELLRELICAGECLRELSSDASTITACREPGSAAASEFHRLLCEYHDNLETLWRLLPDFHGRALAERARLTALGEHLDSTIAWAGTNRSTL